MHRFCNPCARLSLKAKSVPIGYPAANYFFARPSLSPTQFNREGRPIAWEYVPAVAVSTSIRKAGAA